MKTTIVAIVAIVVSWFFATQADSSVIGLWYGIGSFFLGIGGLTVLINGNLIK